MSEPVNVSAPADSVSSPDDRILFFAQRTGGRYWWYRQIGDSYLPDLYRLLSDSEWQVLCDWYVDTDEKVLVGECAVPLISWITSFVSANNISRIVQLGTYAGYSALLLGWALQRMRKAHSLLAVDIDTAMCSYAESWIERASLGDIVRIHRGNSADSNLPALAAEYLGGAAQLVFIDSSHQYQHTLQELDLWYDALPEGSAILMHDVSEFAATFDSTGSGGVRRALAEWRAGHDSPALSLTFRPYVLGGDAPVYLDSCGLGVILKQ